MTVVLQGAAPRWRGMDSCVCDYNRRIPTEHYVDLYTEAKFKKQRKMDSEQ